MRSFRLPAIVLALAAQSVALAQEQPSPAPPPIYPPPPQYAPLYTPPDVPPPPDFMPPPTTDQIDGLEHAGRHKVVGGTVLVASGAALVAVGTGLAISSLFVDNNGCTSGHHFDSGQQHCGNAAFAAAGGTSLLLGVAAIVPGAFLRDKGVREVAAARALRRRACCGWSLRPSVTRGGALAGLTTSF